MNLPTSHHTLAIIKAVLNAIPTIGGPLASLVGDYIPTATQKNVDKALTHLQAQLTALGAKSSPNCSRRHTSSLSEAITKPDRLRQRA
jgi:hypothetical protein